MGLGYKLDNFIQSLHQDQTPLILGVLIVAAFAMVVALLFGGGKRRRKKKS
jgi:predicted outer membrane lipoprotein